MFNPFIKYPMMGWSNMIQTDTKQNSCKRPILVKRWPSAYVAGPAYSKHWAQLVWWFPSQGEWSPVWVISPAHTKHSTNVVLILGQRLRRWPNIRTTLCERLMCAGRFAHRLPGRPLTQITRAAWINFRAALIWSENKDCWNPIVNPFGLQAF